MYKMLLNLKFFGHENPNITPLMLYEALVDQLNNFLVKTGVSSGNIYTVLQKYTQFSLFKM